MRVLTPEQARQRVAGWMGCDPASDAGLLEALRLELLAASPLPRHQLLARAHQRLGLGETERPGLAEALARLEQAGDASAGPGGLVAATPARLVEAGRRRYALLGSVGAQQVLSLAPEASLAHGSPRRLANLGPEAAEALAAALGGRVLSLEQGTGLHRSSSSKAWLERLDRRLSGARAGELAWLADQGEVECVEVAPGSDPPRHHWKVGGLRARSLARVQRPEGDVFGLLVGDDERAPALPLTRDEASRTLWALLAREGGGAQIEAVCAGEGLRRVSWPLRLPRAEWRALRLLDRASEPAQAPEATIGDDDLEQLAELLSDRLGARLHLARDTGPAISPEASKNADDR